MWTASESGIWAVRAALRWEANFLPAHLHSTAWGWVCCIRLKVGTGQLRTVTSLVEIPTCSLSASWIGGPPPFCASVSQVGSLNSLQDLSPVCMQVWLQSGVEAWTTRCRTCRWAVLQGLEGMSAVMGLLPACLLLALPPKTHLFLVNTSLPFSPLDRNSYNTHQCFTYQVFIVSHFGFVFEVAHMFCFASQAGLSASRSSLLLIILLFKIVILTLFSSYKHGIYS